MANEISLVTASGRTVTPKDDGIIYEVFSPGNGIIYGGAVTIKDSSTLHIAAGHGIVCGRKFTIDDSDIPVALSGSGSLLGRLYIHLDLADAADPITLLVETGESLTPVVQDADVNINNGVYEINIATFDVDTVTISNLVTIDVSVKPMGDMEGATSALDGKGGYVPAPQAGDEDKVLRGDGTWGSAGDTATVRYYNGYIQYTDDGGTTWKNGIAVGAMKLFVPIMASSSEGGYVASSSAENSGQEAYHAFNRDGENGWGYGPASNDLANSWLKIKLPSAKAIRQAEIYNKLGTYGRDDVVYYVEGSNDDITWNILASAQPTITNKGTANAIVSHVFDLSATASLTYVYYRLRLSQRNAYINSSQQYVGMNIFNLYE